MKSRLPSAVRRLPSRVRLAVALEAMPEPDRVVLALRLLEGLTAAEAAGALRMSAREVEQRLGLALSSPPPGQGARAAQPAGAPPRAGRRGFQRRLGFKAQRQVVK